jgi:DNA-directed RNA polymerase subunit RPC12/RpoP
MTHTKANKSKILMLVLGLTMCLALMLGIVFASPTSTVYAEGEDGTAPTIVKTGGIDVDRKNHMGNLPAAIKGKPYKAEDGSNYKIEATGTEPFTFHAYKSGEGRAPLPEGLSLNSVTGEIEGTPTGDAGKYNISVTVTNKFGSDNIFVGMYVYDETSKPQITTPAGALPDGYLNSSYNQKIDFTHNMSNFPEVSIASGALPDGLTIIRQGITATIYGTPTKARTFTFTVRVENGAGFDEKQYTITIKNEIVRPEIQMDMTVIKDGYSKVNDSGHLEIIKGKPVDVQFYATGTNTSTNPIKWSCDETVLPAGLTLSESGHLTGIVAESVDLGYSGNKYFYIKLKATNKNSSGVEQSNTSSAPLIVYENGKITRVTISPENTSVPKGGQRQFTATVIGYGDFDKSVTWNVYYHSSKDTKISQDGVLTVGVDETATEIGVEARIDRDTFKEIPVTIIDHTHSITLVPKTPKTCTTDGNIEHYKCNVCGDLFADARGVNVLTEEQVKIPAGHEYGDLVPKQEPTCTQTGMQAHYKCSVCNKYFDESKTEKTVAELTISINPNAHDFGAWIEEVPATCVVTGTKGHKDCNRCNRHFDESGNEITDLTIPTNDNHDWNDWVSNGNGTHTRTCKRDSDHKETGTCSGGKATCTSKAVCEVCRTTYGGFALHNTTQYGGKDSSGHWDKCSNCDNKLNFEAHTPDREKADETNPVKCTKCGFVITPAGHYNHTADSEWHNSADGKYHYHKCTHSGCSEILDKANHSGGTATCENKAVCSVCGLEYGDKLGHDYGEVKYTWTDNVCKAERVCKHDSTHIESETVTATGTTITAATCKEKGKMKYTATFTNKAFAAQVKEVDIDFAEHTYGELIPEVPATADKTGTKKHFECSVCGKLFDENKNEVTAADLVIPKIVTHNVVINGESNFYKEGESVTVTAEDKEGKEFVGWQDESGKIVSTQKEYTFVVKDGMVLTAVYQDKAPGGGTIDGEIAPAPDKKGLSGGQIAGIVIGSLAGVGIVGFAIFWFVVKKKSFAELISAIKALFNKKQ